MSYIQVMSGNSEGGVVAVPRHFWAVLGYPIERRY